VFAMVDLLDDYLGEPGAFADLVERVLLGE
jgi:hypothetical protein